MGSQPSQPSTQPNPNMSTAITHYTDPLSPPGRKRKKDPPPSPYKHPFVEQKSFCDIVHKVDRRSFTPNPNSKNTTPLVVGFHPLASGTEPFLSFLQNLLTAARLHNGSNQKRVSRIPEAPINTYRYGNTTPAAMKLLLDVARENLEAAREKIYEIVRVHYANDQVARVFVNGLGPRTINDSISGCRLYGHKEGEGEGYMSPHLHCDTSLDHNRLASEEGRIGTWVVR